MPTITNEMTAPRVIPRRLQAVEHRAVLAAGDAVAGTAAVVVALWLWSIPAGWEFSSRTIADRPWWFVAVPLWMLAASLPAAPASIAFSVRRTLGALARGGGILLIAYVGWYFY